MKILSIPILALMILVYAKSYYGASTAPVVIAGGIIKAAHIEEPEKKYKRSECPVCKGKGWYISGDKIEKVECGYCEPDISNNINQINKPRVIIHKK